MEKGEGTIEEGSGSSETTLDFKHHSVVQMPLHMSTSFSPPITGHMVDLVLRLCSRHLGDLCHATLGPPTIALCVPGHVFPPLGGLHLRPHREGARCPGLPLHHHHSSMHEEFPVLRHSPPPWLQWDGPARRTEQDDTCFGDPVCPGGAVRTRLCGVPCGGTWGGGGHHCVRAQLSDDADGHLQHALFRDSCPQSPRADMQ